MSSTKAVGNGESTPYKPSRRVRTVGCDDAEAMLPTTLRGLAGTGGEAVLLPNGPVVPAKVAEYAGASVRDAEEKLKFDLFYVKNHGLVFDLMILLQTVEVVLFGRGAR